MFSEDDYRLAIKDFDLDKLIDAYAKMTYRAVQQELRLEPKTIQKERFSIDNRMHHICEVLIEQKRRRISALSKRTSTKSTR